MHTDPSNERGLVRELQRSHRATVVTLCAMLALSVLASGYLLLVGQPQVVRYTALTRDARLMHEAMLDQETGLRGWLATGDPLFLDPYDEGRTRALGLADQILERSAVDSEITADLVPVLLAQQRWESWALRASQLEVDQGDRTNGELTTMLLRGKELFDDYREADETSTRRVVGARDAAMRSQSAAQLAALISILLLLTTAGVLATLRRRRLERTVLAPMGSLLATIRALRAGDLSARFVPSGVVELDAVGAGLGALADDLHAADELATAREARLALLARRLETVIRVARETSGSLNVRYVSESVASAAAELLSVPTSLWVRGDDGTFRATRRSDDAHGAVPPSDLVAPALVATVAADARPSSCDGSRAYPLVLAGMVVGVLEVSTPSVDDDVEHVLEALLSTAAAAMESARLHSSARELAEMDALTQLPNRRRLETDLLGEWERSRRYDRPLTFVMLDLDHFKRLNDTHGHLVGDLVLNAAAAAVADSLRGTDTAYRYGGEEIAVLLRETDIEEAIVVAERLRAAVAAVTVDDSAATVTASIGLAQADGTMAHHSQLVAAADSALYRAKREGRDRVEAYDVLPVRV